MHSVRPVLSSRRARVFSPALFPKTFSLRHSRFLYQRPLLTVQHPTTHGETDQVVRILRREPFYSWSRYSLRFAYFIGTWIVFRVMLGKLGGVDLETDEDVDEAEDELDSAFIAFSYPEKLPRTLYKHSDPDWQEFVRISRDKDLKNAIRQGLADRVAHDVSKHPHLAKALGSDIHVTKYWLDLKFPDGPPPEYSRWGLYANEKDDNISWQQQNISHEHYVQLQHILYPRAMFIAAYTSARVLAHLQLVKIKTALGLPLNDRDRQGQLVLKMEKAHQTAQMMSDEAAEVDEKTAEQRKRLEQELREASDSGEAKGDASKPILRTGTSSATISDPSNQPMLPISIDLRKSLPHKSLPDISIAWKSFISTLSQAWSTSLLDKDPKGALYVVGQVEVFGSNGRARCDISAAFDPRRREFHYVVCKVNHFWEHHQSAKGK